MAILKGKENAGQGGKIGHSNQNQWQHTEETKEAARKWRRLNAKSEIAAGLKEVELTDEAEQNDVQDQSLRGSLIHTAALAR